MIFRNQNLNTISLQLRYHCYLTFSPYRDRKYRYVFLPLHTHNHTSASLYILYMCVVIYLKIINITTFTTSNEHHRFYSSLWDFLICNFLSGNEKLASQYQQYIYLFLQSLYIFKVISELLEQIYYLGVRYLCAIVLYVFINTASNQILFSKIDFGAPTLYPMTLLAMTLLNSLIISWNFSVWDFLHS